MSLRFHYAHLHKLDNEVAVQSVEAVDSPSAAAAGMIGGNWDCAGAVKTGSGIPPAISSITM